MCFLFWVDAFHLLKTIIVFGSPKTINQVLQKANFSGRFAFAPGAIIPVMFPTHGHASLCLGMGPWANGALRLGIVTNQEYEAGQESKKA